MKCEKCGSEELTATQTHTPLRCAIEYRIRCDKCNNSWKCLRGNRFLNQESRENHRNNWANVKIMPSRLTRLLDLKMLGGKK
jgi:hypothetical protein